MRFAKFLFACRCWFRECMQIHFLVRQDFRPNMSSFDCNVRTWISDICCKIFRMRTTLIFVQTTRLSVKSFASSICWLLYWLFRFSYDVTFDHSFDLLSDEIASHMSRLRACLLLREYSLHESSHVIKCLYIFHTLRFSALWFCSVVYWNFLLFRLISLLVIKFIEIFACLFRN